MQRLGVEFGIPENAEDITYYVLKSENLAEMQFTWNDMRYTARMKPAAEFEDISGLYYEAWDYEDACKIQWCEAVTSRVFDEGVTVDLCLWYDAVPGIMYSVTASARDLDGFDITASAYRLFLPAQTGE